MHMPTHRFPSLKSHGNPDGLAYFHDPYLEVCVDVPTWRREPLPPAREAPLREPSGWQRLSDTAKVCLATGVSALVIALLGSVVNLFVDSWFQAAGMAAVGVFYLVLFATNVRRPRLPHFQGWTLH